MEQEYFQKLIFQICELHAWNDFIDYVYKEPG
jgi:hypothetical protein